MKVYNLQVRLPFFFDADVQFTRSTEGVPFVECYKSDPNTVEICVGSMRAYVSTERPPPRLVGKCLGWTMALTIGLYMGAEWLQTCSSTLYSL